MMQLQEPYQTRFNPCVADIALDIDTKHNRVTLSGVQYQFDDAKQMERFLRTLWDSETPYADHR